MKTWESGSFARAILIALLLVSIVPILVISILFINQSTTALTRQMEMNLQLLAEAKAEEIDLKLGNVLDATAIAARQTRFALEQNLTAEEVSQYLTRYKVDNRNILGLDVYYESAGGAEVLGDNLSNVYWNGADVYDAEVARQIVETEALDATFESIKSVSPETQWIYFTTPEGMMRLYPWASNDHYPDNWDPREIIFYTVAAPENNPNLETRWTPPYVDFAGAGWMVTVSTPVLDANSEFLGIMSHDITIQSLKDIALNINVLDGAGYGFLIDQEGNVIAHPQYEDTDASEGAQATVNLTAVGSPVFRELIGDMTTGATGLGYYQDEGQDEHILVYSPIPSIGWSLGIVVPRTAVVAPATAMSSRALIITVLLVGAASVIAVTLARRMHQPIFQLLQGVEMLSADTRPDEIQVHSFRELRTLAAAFNDMASKIWERERNLKTTVAQLRIQIDTQRSQKEIHALTETDYFQYLEKNADRIRADLHGENTPTSAPARPKNEKRADAETDYFQGLELNAARIRQGATEPPASGNGAE